MSSTQSQWERCLQSILGCHRLVASKLSGVNATTKLVVLVLVEGSILVKWSRLVGG